ncbi:hypothetical protein D3C81_2174380 [compost metagenome]
MWSPDSSTAKLFSPKRAVRMSGPTCAARWLANALIKVSAESRPISARMRL